MSRPTSSAFAASRKSGISLALNGSSAGASGGAAGGTMRDKLAARSRVTNLGVVLLLAATSISVLFNLRYMAGGYTSSFKIPPPGFGSWESFHGLTPENLRRSQPDPAFGAEKLNHLVIVASHAVWAGCDFTERESDESWILQDFQRGGSVKTYWKHIEKGIEMADADPSALLVFSGGQTRPTSLQTEAESYFSLAVSSHMNIPVLPGFNETLIPTGKETAAQITEMRARLKALKTSKVATAKFEEVMGKTHTGSKVASNAAVAAAPGLHGVRMTTENFALDSFQNLLFSIARFKEFTGHYPTRISVIGYGMKKSRFEELHAKAIRWPLKSYVQGQRRWHYIGIDDEGDTKPQYEGEKIKGYRPYELDMYGCNGLLLAKRQARNPTRRFHPYYTSAPELADLLAWCPADGLGLQGIYPQTLPWDLRVTTDGWGRGAKKYKEEHQGPQILPDNRWLEINREGH